MIQAGLNDSDAFSMGVGTSAMGFVGTVGSWFLMPHFGRRTLYLWGQLIMFCVLMVIGGLGVPPQTSGVSWGSGAMILILTFVYDFTVGPVCYSLVAELPSTRLRIKTVVLSRNLYNIMGIIISVIQPRFMNPTALNWRGKTGFFWGGLCACGIVWTYFRLPEPKGLTYGKLDIPLAYCHMLTQLQPNLMSSLRTKFLRANSERSTSTHGDLTTWSLSLKRMPLATSTTRRSCKRSPARGYASRALQGVSDWWL